MIDQNAGSDEIQRAPWSSFSLSDRVGLPLTSMIIVFDSNDVVFSQIAAGLDFDQLERNFSGVLQSVRRADWNIDRLVFIDELDEFIDGHTRRTSHDDPMLGSVMVLLQRELATGLYDDALDLMPLAIVDRLIRSPRPINLDMAFGNLGCDSAQLRH